MTGGKVTRLLRDWSAAKSDAERERLENALVASQYDELRKIARHLVASDQIQTRPTGLVDEVWMRLTKIRAPFRGRQHYIGAAIQEMRRSLIDRARRRNASKRGGHAVQETLDEGVAVAAGVDLDRVIAVRRALAGLSPPQQRFVDLRYREGYTVQEAAEILGINVDTAKKRWRVIEAALVQELSEWRGNAS